MNEIDVLVRFVAASLAFGLGLFVLSGSVRSIRTPTGAVLLAIPSVLGFALAAWGLLTFVRVVPW